MKMILPDMQEKSAQPAPPQNTSKQLVRHIRPLSYFPRKKHPLKSFDHLLGNSAGRAGRW